MIMSKEKLSFIGGLCLMVLLSVLLRPNWFNLQNIFTNGDWHYWSDDSIKIAYSHFGTWASVVSLGNEIIQPYYLPIAIAWSTLGTLGLSYSSILFITYLIFFTLVGFSTSYLYFYYETKNPVSAVLGGLFYLSTSYGIANQLPIQIVYVLAPAILLLLRKFLDGYKISYALILSVIFSICIFYEIRIAILVGVEMVLLFIFELPKINRTVMPKLFIIFTSVLGLNFFWIFSLINSSSSIANISDVMTRGLFGSRLFDIVSSLTIHVWYWKNGVLTQSFDKNPIDPYTWIIIIFVFIAYLFTSRNKQTKNLWLFYFSLVLFGVFLSKQDNPPYSSIYSTLYHNIPLFSLYREASKFHTISSLGFAGLLAMTINAISLMNVKNHKIKRYCYVFATSITFFLILLNNRGFITNSIGGMYLERKIPNDYEVLQVYFKKQPEYFRTLYTPIYSRWSIWTSNHPILSYLDLEKFIQSNSRSPELKIPSFDKNKPIWLLNQNFSSSLIDYMNIKYVVIPIEDITNNDNFFADYEPRALYISQLDQLSFLKKIDIGTEELVVYENSDFRPHIYSTNEMETLTAEVPFQEVNHSFVNPTEYKITLTNINEPFYINFAENYHPDWSIRAGNFNWFEVIQDKNYFIDSSIHSKTEAGLNTFYINSQEICSQYECKRNTDGTYNINLTLYFKAQSYLYLGGIISLTTLAGILSYLLGYAGRAIYLKLRTKSQKHV